MIEAEAGGTLHPLKGGTEKHNFYREASSEFRHLNKTISTILAKISNLNDVTHKIGPFIFFSA
ncbi:MAG: hypothetical protein ACJ0DF_12355 [Paracoccaceae bacterium]